MAGIIGIIALLIVLGLSLVITQIAAAALSYTGLSSEAARFQARSAFTGTGFTTSEAERIVDHPVRRRIVMLLMVVRSAGLVTIIISLVLSFASTGDGDGRLTRLLWLLGGVVVLWGAANSGPVERGLRRAIRWGLQRWTDLDVRDYAGLLKLSGDYAVTELKIEEENWLAGKQLSECRLTDEGVTVLGISRADGDYLGVPQADTEVRAGDTLILYGREDSLEELDTRPADASGDQAHERAKADQDREVAEQQRRDEGPRED